MGRLTARNRTVTAHNRRKSETVVARRRAALMEALEERRLMSLTVEVRALDGSSSINVASVGQVLNLQILGVVTAGTPGSGDTNLTVGQPSTYGINDVTGSFLSTGIFSHDVAGDLGATLAGPFQANGAQQGTPQDLNGDGNIDVGSNNAAQIQGDFFARHGGIDTNGTASASSMTIVLGTLTYTVTNLNGGGETDINFRPRPTGAGSIAANWYDGVQYGSGGSVGQYASDRNSIFQGGTPFVITDTALNPAPVVNTDNVNATRNVPLTVDALANVTTADALTATSVTIGTAPAHGTAVAQPNGSIIYTPTMGYTGADTFTYHVTDANGRVSNNGPVNVTIAIPPPPTTVADTANTLRNQPVTISVLTNDTVPAGSGTIAPASVTVVTAPAHGTAVAQTNGTVVYTPVSAFVGTDTFTYTVADTLGDISAPATVTVTTALPAPPVANNDVATDVEGGPATIAVLTNDTSASAAFDPTKVVIGAAAAHGTAVPRADGTVVYTSTPGFIGTDSFTYTATDVLGDTSNAATVTVTVTAAPPPVASSFTAPFTIAGGAPINVLGNASSVTTLVPGGVAVTTLPVDGTATVNATTGAILYTPKAGFVGADTFSYTVTDANGNTSAPGTVTVNVGATLSSAKGGNRSITFSDTTGGTEIVTLNVGTANVLFSGTGTVTTGKGGKVTVGGSNLEIAGIELTGTTRASALVVRSVGNKAVTIGGIADSSPLGTITAKSAALSGIANVSGLGSLTVASTSNATLTIGSGGAPRVSLSLGAVTASSIASSIAIASLKVASWTNGAASALAITAPSIGTIVSTGGFDPKLNVSPTGKTAGIASARIIGALGGGWTDTGTAGPITAGSVASAWIGKFTGALSSLTIKSGGLASALTAGSIGSLLITGDLTSTITAASARSIRVTGNITGATLDFTGTGGLGQLTASSLVNSVVTAGVTAGTTLTTAAAGNIGTALIGTIQLTGRTGNQFANSSIMAGKIHTAALGAVNTSNGGAGEGIATRSIGAVTGIFGATSIHLGHNQLVTEPILQTYLGQQHILFSDFVIEIF